MEEFERCVDKCIVLKTEDINSYLDLSDIIELQKIKDKINFGRMRDRKLDLSYVVVQDNWGSLCDEVWNLLEDYVSKRDKEG